MARHINDAVRGVTVQPKAQAATAGIYNGGVGRYLAMGLLLLTMGAATLLGTGCATTKEDPWKGQNLDSSWQIGTASIDYKWQNIATGKISTRRTDPLLREAYATCRRQARANAFTSGRRTDPAYTDELTEACMTIRKGYELVGRE